jgi:uncharacterized protein (TIGR00251 family)
MIPLDIQATQGGVAFVVKVVPGSSRTSIAGTLNSMLKVKVAASPERGKANEALIDFLAGVLGVKKNAVTITRGHANPVKHITVAGLTTQALVARLGLGA